MLSSNDIKHVAREMQHLSAGWEIARRLKKKKKQEEEKT